MYGIVNCTPKSATIQYKVPFPTLKLSSGTGVVVGADAVVTGLVTVVLGSTVVISWAHSDAVRVETIGQV